MVEMNSNTQKTITTTSSVVSDEKNNANGRRLSIILINASTGGQVITLAVGSEAAAGYGIPLNPGGSWQDSRDSGYYPTQAQITAVSSAAGGLLSVQERVGW